MKVAYFDCFSGVSGDMILGALVDAGLNPDTLKKALAGLRLPGYEISVKKVVKNGIAATRFNVMVSRHQHGRHLSDILDIINTSSLNERVKQSAADIFRKIGRAEAGIHNVDIQKIHFHELGAVDSIVNVTGVCIAFDLLGIQDIYCSRINVGEGFVNTAHGVLPVPAPATASLLRDVPVYSSGIQAELATPTGAAIMTHFSRCFGPLPEIKIRSVGYGAGMKKLQQPNLLRVFIGEDEIKSGRETILSLETNIDDMNPEFYGHVIERLLDTGALDAYITPVIMKKTRPGTLLTVLACEDAAEVMAKIIFEETTTAGIRYQKMERLVLERKTKRVATRYGNIAVKIITDGGRVRTISPEYEDCRRTAKAMGVPLKLVYEEAKKIISL